MIAAPRMATNSTARAIEVPRLIASLRRLDANQVAGGEVELLGGRTAVQRHGEQPVGVDDKTDLARAEVGVGGDARRAP